MSLKLLADRIRGIINRPDVFEILEEGDWGAGGCWILAEALVQWLGPPARMVVVQYQGLPVDHVVVEYLDVYIDYNGAQSDDEVLARAWEQRPDWKLPKLVPFTKRLQEWARQFGIPCEPWQVQRLISALHQFGERP